MEHEEIPATTPKSTGPSFFISKDATYYWPGTRSWSLFLGILGVIGAALIGLVLLLIVVASKQNFNEDLINRGFGLVLLIYTGWFVVILVMGILLILFSNSLSKAIRHGHSDDARDNSRILLNYFRLAGVISILAILIQAVFFFSLMSNMP